MSVKMSIKTEPIDATAKIHLEIERDGEVFHVQNINAVAATESPVFTVNEGDKLTLSVEPGNKIIMDHAQGMVRVESDEEAKTRREAGKASTAAAATTLEKGEAKAEGARASARK